MDIKLIVRACGGPSLLASLLGYTSHTTIVRWRRVPAEHLEMVERISGIPREKMRPDIFKGLTIVRTRKAPRSQPRASRAA